MLLAEFNPSIERTCIHQGVAQVNVDHQHQHQHHHHHQLQLLIWSSIRSLDLARCVCSMQLEQRQSFSNEQQEPNQIPN